MHIFDTNLGTQSIKPIFKMHKVFCDGPKTTIVQCVSTL
jgi:hypothetical protein